MEFPREGSSPAHELTGAQAEMEQGVTETVLDEIPTAAAVVTFSEQEVTGVKVRPTSEKVVLIGQTTFEEQLDLIEEEFDRSDPAERAEGFLSTTAELFAVSKQSWKEVRAKLIALKNSPELTDEDLKKLGNRQKRRGKEFRASYMGSTDKAIAYAQYRAQSMLEDNTKPPANFRYGFTESVHNFQARLRKDMAEMPIFDLDELGLDEEWVTEEMKTKFTNLNELRALTFEAKFLDHTIERVLAEGVEDREGAEPFVKRLSELLNDEQAAQEFPGLLEAIANHVRKHGDRSALAVAYKATAPEPRTQAKAFMEAALEGDVNPKQDRVRAQLEAATYATKLFVDQEDDTWLTTAAERWADRYDDWEEWQKTELANHVKQKRNNEWNQFTAALSRHVNPGRLAGMSISGNKQFKPGQAIKPNKTFEAALATSEPEAKQEPEPITQFALLERSGSGSQRSSGEFALTSVDSLEAILDSKPFASYLSDYKEKGMREHFERALQYLTTNWFDHKTTRRLTSGRYQTDETPQRNARRLSLRTFTGVPTNSVASQTRIIYDVIKVNGKNCLAIRGPFNKADIEDLSQMP